jgi:uncharacterized membrane protein
MQEPAGPKSRSRIETIDLARGAALLAMAVYHFAWDLEFFGYAPGGMTAESGWKFFARSIASSFLFLVGVSLFLAHGEEIRWRGFLRRLALVAGAALAISVATYIATPERFIFFGILHEIALASLLGLAFLRLPPLVTLAVAGGTIAAPHFLRSPLFDHPVWWWMGLSSSNPPSNDYVPVFPWFGAVLAGIAVTKLAARAGLLRRLARVEPGRWSLPLQFAGRHSLLVYLLHQPILIGFLWVYAQINTAGGETREVQFLQACQAECAAQRDGDFCVRYCVCVLDRLEQDDILDGAFGDSQNPQIQSAIGAIAAQCSTDADTMPEGDIR